MPVSTREEKNTEVAWIADHLQKSMISFIVDYQGLTVSDISTLRQNLRDAGAVSRVTKNTLSKIASNEVLADNDPSDLEKFSGLFQGPSLLVFGVDEAVAPAKVLTKFAKDNDKLEIKGAWFDNSFLDTDGVKAVSAMPSREETLAKLLSLLNTPAQQLLRLMNAPAQQLAQVISAHQKNLA